MSFKNRLAALGTKTMAVIVVFILVFSVIGLGLSGLFGPKPLGGRYEYSPTEELPGEYIIIAEQPESAWDHFFIASLSSIAVRGDDYNPIFITDEGRLDDRIMSTLAMTPLKDRTALVFTDDDQVFNTVSGQLKDAIRYTPSDTVLGDFIGFDGAITVGSYEETLWVAPIAHLENKVIVWEDETFECQEDAWEYMLDIGHEPTVAVVTNSSDYVPDIWGKYYDPFLIESLSTLASTYAARYDAMVLTRWDPYEPGIGDYDLKLNARQSGLHLALQNLSRDFGPFDWVTLIGSAASVPQFILPTLADGGSSTTASDSIYGFLDEDLYTLDTPVGRMINWNLPGLSNQYARTWFYDDFQDTTTVRYTQEGEQTVRWRDHGSVWNGFEVADQRMQMTPGWYMKDDLLDEGWTYDYMRTTGNEGYREVGTGKEIDFQPIMERSALVVYRGHGSSHASMYVYEPDEEYSKGRIEGYVEDFEDTNMRDVDSVHHYNLPPQIGVLICCLNSQIISWNGETPHDKDTYWSTNYMYGGAIALFASTEVSYSNIGQDIKQIPGRFTGDYAWDNNDHIYATLVDGLVDHEQEYDNMGKVFQWCINRYNNNPLHDGQVTPFLQEGNGLHWKQISMYTLYGDPGFGGLDTKDGANDFDPWHNGEEDK